MDPATDALWQSHFQRLVPHQALHYHLPHNTLANHFLTTLATLLDKVRAREFNFETPMVYTMVVLQGKPTVTRNRDIAKLMTARLDSWDNGHHASLVHQCEMAMIAQLRRRQGTSTPAQRHRHFNCWRKHRPTQG